MSQSRNRRRREQRGQSMVETAIVMPLFVFLLLGIIQLALMHQARSMTKYAAFRAARTGSLNNGNHNKMEREAFEVVKPLLELRNRDNMRHIRVQVCSPSRQMLQQARNAQALPNASNTNDNFSFDYPLPPSQTNLEARILAVQVTFYYPMIIPFANSIIHTIYNGQRTTSDVLRMGRDTATAIETRARNTSDADRASMANLAPFVVPIRANYALPIQSDLPLNAPHFPENINNNPVCERL